MNTLETKTKTPAQTKACPPERRGSGLIFAVVLLFVILGMVITLSSITVLETKMNQKTKSSIGAFYNSESGVEWALNKISISSGTISGTLSANTDGSVTCPISPDCKVYFLKSDGTVITQANFSTLTFNDIKAVRSVGTQGGETQRAIEAAVAAGGGASFTYYCNLSTDKLPTPSNICTNAGGTQGYCPSGFKQILDLGSWGYCWSSGGAWDGFFRPPGGGCLIDWTIGYGGEAYVCSQ